MVDSDRCLPIILNSFNTFCSDISCLWSWCAKMTSTTSSYRLSNDKNLSIRICRYLLFSSVSASSSARFVINCEMVSPIFITSGWALDLTKYKYGGSYKLLMSFKLTTISDEPFVTVIFRSLKKLRYFKSRNSNNFVSLEYCSAAAGDNSPDVITFCIRS